ncbi:MAG: hypothetical protein KDA72_15005, partial [Planctomycetales bacterium]|nr:hypothetical protein [Planctomycetales bacterium]
MQKIYSQSLIGVGDSFPRTVSNQLVLSDVETSSHSAELFDPQPATLMGCDTRPYPISKSPTNDWEPVRLSEVFPLFHTDSSFRGMAVEAESDGNYGSLLFLDYDAFMGRPDAGWTNNGVRVGFSFANRLGALTERTGIRSQVGASVGVYDWAGTDYRLQHKERA